MNHHPVHRLRKIAARLNHLANTIDKAEIAPAPPTSVESSLVQIEAAVSLLDHQMGQSSASAGRWTDHHAEPAASR